MKKDSTADQRPSAYQLGVFDEGDEEDEVNRRALVCSVLGWEVPIRVPSEWGSTVRSSLHILFNVSNPATKNNVIWQDGSFPDGIYIEDILPEHVPQAFSHFTYIVSEKRKLVCDLQGVYNEVDGFVLTDPVGDKYMMLIYYDDPVGDRYMMLIYYDDPVGDRYMMMICDDDPVGDKYMMMILGLISS